MSQENVEIVKRGFDAYNAGDLIALREVYDPDVVWHHLEGWPEPGPSVGREAVLREVERLREAWQEGDSLGSVSDFREAANQVLVRMAWRGSGRGPDAVMEFTYLFTLRNRRAITIEMFWDHAEALEVAGLSE